MDAIEHELKEPPQDLSCASFFLSEREAASLAVFRLSDDDVQAPPEMLFTDNDCACG